MRCRARTIVQRSKRWRASRPQLKRDPLGSTLFGHPACTCASPFTRATKTQSAKRGLFSALYELRDEGRLTDYELIWFNEQGQWFNAHLKGPKPLNDPAAIMWFKSTATEHIARMRALAALLEHKDMSVATFESEKPGYILYEDEYQVAAIPFSRETFGSG